MRRLFWILPAILLTGCAARAPRPDDVFGTALRNAARGVATGQAFDAALLAARRGNEAAFESAMERLSLSDPPASSWMSIAQSLNNLGFPLADEGHSMEEFRRAEDLTRRSLAYFDRIIGAQPPKSRDLPALRFNRELSAHDSLAWALYRQGRFDEALREQTSAITVAKINAPNSPGANAGLADMFYHLGKIQQALGHLPEARGAFAEALKLQPDHEKAKREIGK